MTIKNNGDNNSPLEGRLPKKEAISAAENAHLSASIESSKYMEAYKKLVERVLPNIDLREPSTFAAYGSAEKYYENSFSYIYNSYPYDGSALEKVEWSLSASAIDLGILQHEYPKETGFVSFSPSGWGSTTSTQGRYSLSSNPEYIKFSGGPYVGSVFNSGTGRESGLKISPSTGNTLEFWLKKDSFASGSTPTEVIFDSYTIDFSEGEDSYGRFLLELSGTTGSPFHLTYMSGTTGLDRVQVGQNITESTVADGEWHHYAFVLSHSGSTLRAEVYVDGKYNSTTTDNVAEFNPVSGYFNGTIGALATQKDSSGGLGYGKLLGSLDEVRFWKSSRTAKDVENYFDFPVNGATDKEEINSILGLYYKFNEGTVSVNDTDKVILDYSGRLNNGEFVGYTSASRNSGSAITNSSATTEQELGDPIMNPNSDRVRESLNYLVELGKSYDEYNNSSIFKSVPQWAYDPSAGSSNLESDFSILLQAMASKFDSIKILIDGLPKIGYTQYSSLNYKKGTTDYKSNFPCILGCEREFVSEYNTIGPQGEFSTQNLLGRGFDVEELPIINKVNLDEYIYNLKFGQVNPNSDAGSFLVESKAEIVKNRILENVYNNLHTIYETKGTEASFRNLIRCFGVDEKLLAPNVYINNGEIILKEEGFSEVSNIRVFSANDENREATIYQTASAADERWYIEGKDSGSVSYEVKTIFPSYETQENVNVTSSIFGINEVDTSTFEIDVPNSAGILLTSVKSNLENKGSTFVLSSPSGLFSTITSPYFSDVFSNTVWNFAVRFTEDTGVKLAGLNEKGIIDSRYKVEFSGYQYEQDVLVASFSQSAEMLPGDYLSFILSNKSVFLGAQREDITGSVQLNTENKFLSFSAWDDYLDDTEVKEHAKSADNIGRIRGFHEEDDNIGRSRLRADALALNWQFDDVSIQNSVATVLDHSSGSLVNVSAYGPSVGYKYPGSSTSLASPQDIIKPEALSFIKYAPIDNARSKSKVEIKEREIDSFELDSRPISYIYTYEKSMYQVISREMLRMLAGVSAYNNLIGEPIYKYRQDYKSLEKLRERFFGKMEGDLDLERFIEYYKWIDSSLGKMLQQLQPATAAMKLGLEDVVESHALERNKYKHQAPVFEFKDPKIEGQILGINELLYDWEHGHAPQPVFWAKFDGVDDFISVPDDDSLSFGNSATDSPFSLSAWVVFTDPQSTIQSIIGKYNANTASEYLMFNNNGFLQVNLYDFTTPNRLQVKTDSVVFEEGKLYHVVVTYNGAGWPGVDLVIYINGVEVAQTTSLKGSYTAMHNTGVDLQIGSTVAGTFDFARNMHHVMIFDDELSSQSVSELYELYDNGRLEVSSNNFTAYNNLVSWWRLDQKDIDASAALDAVGSNHGVFEGDTTIQPEYIRFALDRDNCLWWNDRAERNVALAVSGAANDERQELNTRINTVVSGSTYVVRNLARPYRIEAYQRTPIKAGFNSQTNKNTELYKIINSGQDILLNSSSIQQQVACDDLLHLEEANLYHSNVDVTNTQGYLDVDSDTILPFSLVSSSVGTDLSFFKDNLTISNNHLSLGQSGEEPLRGPFTRTHVGGMPHRRVALNTDSADRPEAYSITSLPTFGESVNVKAFFNGLDTGGAVDSIGIGQMDADTLSFNQSPFAISVWVSASAASIYGDYNTSNSQTRGDFCIAEKIGAAGYEYTMGIHYDSSESGTVFKPYLHVFSVSTHPGDSYGSGRRSAGYWTSDFLDFSDGWKNITFSFNGITAGQGGEIRIFVNGRTQSTQLKAGTSFDSWPLNAQPMPNTTSNFEIAKECLGPNGSEGGAFLGKIADLCVFKGSYFTQAEASEVYNGGKVKDMTTHSRYSKLVAWYKMGDDEDTLAQRAAPSVGFGSTLLKDYVGTANGLTNTYIDPDSTDGRSLVDATDLQSDLEVIPGTIASGSLKITEVGSSLPRSRVFNHVEAASHINIRNVNHASDGSILGNYDKVYEIVQTAGRNVNNRLISKSGSISIEPISDGRVHGTVDYTIPNRPRSEHIFVNRFSSPGGPETMAHGSRDLESGEFSIYNVMNYRNLSVRTPLNKLHTERSEQFGYRSGSTTQASVHKTNRNYFHDPAGEKRPDNFHAQHPIPQNDTQYSWVTASTDTTAIDFVKSNSGFGHQHSFTKESKSAIHLLSSSVSFQNPMLLKEIIGDSSTAPSDAGLAHSVSVEGQFVFAGMPYDAFIGESREGTVRVYKNVGSRWVEQPVLTASNGASNDAFGFSVDASDSTVAVGSIREDVQFLADGAVYIYDKNQDDSWSETTIITPSSSVGSSIGDVFGYSLRLTGSTLIVGAPGYGPSVAPTALEGAAFIFDKNQNWAQVAFLTASEGQTDGDEFGRSVYTDGATAVVGAPKLNTGGEGKAYIYSKSPEGVWQYQQTLTASDAANGDAFGYHVSVEGNTAAIGAFKENSLDGAVYIYEKIGDTWSETQKLTPDTSGSNVLFGNGQVIIDGGFIFVPQTEQSLSVGRVIIFQKVGPAWRKVKEIVPVDYSGITSLATGSRFGSFLDVQGDSLIVGAPYADLNSLTNNGSFYIFSKMGRSWSDVEVSYSGVNLSILDGVDEDTNTLSKYTDATINQLVSHRQGPYGWPTWKQIRGYEHPVVRAHRSSNTYSRVFLGRSDLPGQIISGSQDVSMGSTQSDKLRRLPGISTSDTIYKKISILNDAPSGRASGTVSRTVKNYKEVPVTRRFSPINMTFHGSDAPIGGKGFSPELTQWERGLDSRLPRFFKSRENVQKLNQSLREMSWANDGNYYRQLTNNIFLGEDVELRDVERFASSFGHVGIKKTYQNDITTFAEASILLDAQMEENKDHEFIPFFESLAEEVTNNQGKLLEISYIEKLYPKEINTFTKEAREREEFDFFGWKSNLSDRTILLDGNITHSRLDLLLSSTDVTAFPRFTSLDQEDYQKSFFGLYDAVDVSSNNSAEVEIVSNINSSTWPLDSREDLTAYPVEITNSYINNSSSFLETRDQGTRSEGLFQNDFSTFPLGYNGLYGTPPFSIVYNRRIPQVSGSNTYLAGEAKWEAASGSIGPFYDSYKDYAFDNIRLMGQDHSIVPEFRISEFVEEILNGERSYPDGRRIADPLSFWSDFLSVTGAVHANSSGDLELGGKFFKSYSNSDFMKYFEVIDDKVTENDHQLSHSRITLKCKAAMKFLPYRGFYPAERTEQIYNLFHKNYLSEEVLNTARIRTDSPLTEAQTRRYLDLRSSANRYQVTKPLFGPGVLMNSIKSGIAVDYPIFTGSFDQVAETLPLRLPLTGSWEIDGEYLIPQGSTFTGSVINNTEDLGVPRIKSSVSTRVSFEDILNPGNLFDIEVFDNEPHPSASLQYGSGFWNRIIERPAKFGNLDPESLVFQLGTQLNNTREAFNRQISPYTLAAQNFAAESVNFFVEDGHLTTAISKPIDEYFSSGTVYKMKVRLENLDNVMYDRHSAFGPPVDDSGEGLLMKEYSGSADPSPDFIELTFNDPDADDYQTINTSGKIPHFVMWNLNNNPAIHDGGPLTEFGPFSDLIALYFYSSTHYPYDKKDVTEIVPGGYTYEFAYFDIDDFVSGSNPAFELAYEVKQRLEVYLTTNADRYLSISLVNSSGDEFVIGEDLPSNSYNTLKIEYSSNGPSFLNTSEFTGSGQLDVFSGSSVGQGYPSVFSNTFSETTFAGGVAEGTSIYTLSETAITSSHGFMPYVPPFLDPNSDPYVEITFAPSESRNYTAQEIIEASTFEYYNFKEAPNNSGSNTNYKESMSLSASLNLGICVSLRTDNKETLTDGSGFISDTEDPSSISFSTDIKVDDNKTLDRWVIQTKWETPVLDFSNATAAALDLSSGEEVAVSGSPWKDRYWDLYYTTGTPRSGVTSGSFMTGSIGMWHQKGEIVNSDATNRNKGYFLRIEDSTDDNIAGLASKLGFIDYVENNNLTKGLKKAKEYRSRVGVVEDRKLLKEAVVAIPYVVRKDQDNRVDFVTFNTSLYEQARLNVQSIQREFKNYPLSSEISSIEEYKQFLEKYQSKTRDYISDSPVNAIEYQLFMMEDYILPPTLDFRITKNDPFMMYFFQFHASLEQQDVANIWQNLYPESYSSAAQGRYSCANREFEGRIGKMKDVSYVSHYLDTVSLTGQNLSPVDSVYDLFSPRGTDDKTRWLVFKVKQRGKSNLEEIRLSSIDPRLSNIEKFEYIKESKTSLSRETQVVTREATGDRSLQTGGLQFNWPYDYFSFVELIKLEAKIDSYNYKK